MRSWKVMNMIKIYKKCMNAVESITACNFLPGLFCILLALCSGASHALALEPIYREISGADKSPIILFLNFDYLELNIFYICLVNESLGLIYL